jgi:hypothetical protein
MYYILQAYDHGTLVEDMSTHEIHFLDNVFPEDLEEPQV